MSEVRYINPLIKTDYNDFDEWLSNHDKQIRNEVIDEYTEVLRPMVSSLRSELQNNPHAFIDLDCIARQMKGEQNG